MKPPITVTVRCIVAHEERECSLGEKHTVAIYAEKRLDLTNEVRINETTEAYSDSERENPVYRDVQGRLYDTYVSVDYYSNKRYVRRGDRTTCSTMNILAPCVRVDKVTA